MWLSAEELLLIITITIIKDTINSAKQAQPMLAVDHVQTCSSGPKGQTAPPTG